MLFGTNSKGHKHHSIRLLSKSKTQLVNQRKQKVALSPGTAHSPEIQSCRTWWGAASPILNATPVVCIYTSYNITHIRNSKHRTAVSQLRTSSRTLEIERGRHSRPKVLLSDRTCNICGVLEDETHFLIHCSLYRREREVLLSNIVKFHHGFSEMSDENKFVFLLGNTNRQILTWVNSSTNRGLGNCYNQSGNLITTPNWWMLASWYS